MARFVKKSSNETILNRMRKKLIATGFQMERDIKQSMKVGGVSAPGEPPAVQTGRLRASISTNWTDSGLDYGAVGNEAKVDDGIASPSGKEFRVVVGTNVEYGPYLEFGTSQMEPRPFIRPVFDKYKAKMGKR